MVFRNLKKGLVSLLAASLIAPSAPILAKDSFSLNPREVQAERAKEQLKGNSLAQKADELLKNESLEDHFALKLADYEFFGEDSVFFDPGNVANRLFDLIFMVPSRFKRVQFLGPQRFGKHKINYKELDWKLFDTQHFSIHAYDKSFLDDFISLSELSYGRLSEQFNNKFSDLKVQSYFYKTRRDFEQTNFFPFLVPEGLGGFTFTRSKERNRVVSLFESDFSDWRHVWNHEYTHWHDIQLMEHVKKTKGQNHELPLWLIEGTAEHFSKKWDAADETVIRDAYFHNFFFPIKDLWMVNGSWLMYKEGHFITKYIEENFGHEAILSLRRNLYLDDFKDNVKETLGFDLEELDKRLESYINKLYSERAVKKDIVDKAFKLGDGKPMASHKNFFISGQVEGRRNRLHINHIDELDKLVSEEIVHDQVPGSESLHRFKAGADINEDTVLYSIRDNETDILRFLKYTYDIKEEEFEFNCEEEFRFENEGIEVIRSPAIIDKERAAFIGHKEGFAQIFLFNKKTNSLEQLTSGRSGYNSLDFNKERNLLVFSKEDGSYGSYQDSLYLMDPDTKHVLKLVDLNFNAYAPQFSPDGSKIAFVGDENNVFNLYAYDFNSHRYSRFEDAKIAALSPHWLSDDELLFSSVKEFKPTMHKIKFPGINAAAHEALGKIDIDADKTVSLDGLTFKDGNFFVADKIDNNKELQVQKFAVHNGVLYLQAGSEKTASKTKLFVYHDNRLQNLVKEKETLESVLASDNELKAFVEEFEKEATVVKTIFSDGHKYLGFAVNNKMSFIGKVDKDFIDDFPLSFAVYDAAGKKLAWLPPFKGLESTNDLREMVFAGDNLLLELVHRGGFFSADAVEWRIHDVKEQKSYFPFQGIELKENAKQIISPDGRFIAALGEHFEDDDFETVYVYDVLKKDRLSYGKFEEETASVLKFTSEGKLLFGSNKLFLNEKEKNYYQNYLLLSPEHDELTELNIPWLGLVQDIYVDKNTVIIKAQTKEEVEEEEKKEHLLVGSISKDGPLALDEILTDYHTFKNVVMADGNAVITAVNEYGDELFIYSDKKIVPWSNIKRAEFNAEKNNLIIYDDKARQHIINLEDMVENIAMLPFPEEKEKTLQEDDKLILPKTEFRENTIESRISKWPFDSMDLHLIGAVSSTGMFIDTLLITRDNLWDRLFLVNFTGNFGTFNFGEVGYADTAKNNLYQAYIRHLWGDMAVGASFTHTWPLNRYLQLDLTGAYEFQNMKYFDYEGKNHALKANFGLGYDTTTWSQNGPIHGYRLYANLEAGYSVSENELSNLDINAGFRHYITPHELLTLAYRVEAGTSHGLVPSFYLLGGNMTLRGVPFDGEIGNNYFLVGTDVRSPLFKVVGAVLNEPLTPVSAFFMNYDVEVGMYADFGAAWHGNIYPHRPLDYKYSPPFEPKWSVGWLLNFTTPFGIRLRWDQGIWGNAKDWNFWIGYNW